jgi:hypothetical protein
LVVSLLKQLVQSQFPLPSTVKDLYDRHKDKRTRPSLDEISKALRSVAAIYSRVFIAIDALDELPASSEDCDRLLEALVNLQANEQAYASIFATSRPEVTSQFGEYFRGHMLKHIRATDHDVLSYINGRLSNIRRSRLSKYPDLRNDVRREVVTAADGM